MPGWKEDFNSLRTYVRGASNRQHSLRDRVGESVSAPGCVCAVCCCHSAMRGVGCMLRFGAISGGGGDPLVLMIIA